MENKNKFCINHPNEPIKAKGLCRPCYEKNLLEKNLAYKERQRLNTKKYYLANRERLLEYYRERQKKRSLSPEYKAQRREKRLEKQYNINSNIFREILSFQKNKCAICEQSLYEGDKFLHIDHNHNTGEVRGILCSQCNWFMSKIDSVENTLNNLKKYVKNDGVKWKKKRNVMMKIK